MRPTLRQLQYVVAVAETGRFGDAARRLNVSQPSLSNQIADVEASLGVTLLERGRSGAILTPRGEEFVRRARYILRQVEDLKAAVQHEAGTLSGRIRLGVLPSIGPYLLPAAVLRLHSQYPDLRLGVRDENTVDLERGLVDGRLDTVISTAQDHPGSAHLDLFLEDMWICVPPDHVLADSTAPVALKSLKGQNLLSLGSGHRLAIIVQSIADKAAAYVSSEYEGTSLDALRQMAAMGAGVAVLPSLYTLREARRDEGLCLRRIDHPLARRQISLIWRETSPLAEGFTTLADTLSDVAEDLLVT
ncbi:MAG: LysR substrate-binding domain-containing protein [Pseudomonadota bacterium]